jgi:release factor glutamine methyltransferase
LIEPGATVLPALDVVAQRLERAGCESPRAEAEILLGHVLGVSRSALLADGRRTLSAPEHAALEALVERRERREPLAYVLGEWGFRRLTLVVDARVLVPRPETEVVVERCLSLLAGAADPRVLDVGTGSGAIALAIADEHPGADVTGIDVSGDALTVARVNAARTGLVVSFQLADLHAGLPAGPWDLVVSNPPYVSVDEIGALEPEVRDWEPRLALVGERATEAVARGALEVLRPGGALVLEVAKGEADRGVVLLRSLGYSSVTTTKDLAGRDRVVDAVTTSAD